MSEPAYVAETLAWCNARRGELGQEPLVTLPKGARDDGTSCPCGTATGLWVGLSDYRDLNRVGYRRLPCSVKRFVSAFDAGRLPQYDEAIG